MDHVDLTGQVALVTGGGRGIGREFASALARSGAAVAVTARTREQVEATAGLITAGGGRCLPFTIDVTSYEGMRSVVAVIEKNLGPVDLLVNNAAVIKPLGDPWNVAIEDWWNLFDVNVRGPFLCTRLVLPSMMARRKGRIVNITSGWSYTVRPFASAYCASKAALSHLTACLAPALEPYGISIFALAVGGKTAMTEYIASSTEVPDEARERIRVNLFTEPEEKMQQNVQKLLLLASGGVDGLTGRHISRTDPEEELMAKVNEIVEKDLYAIRLVK